MTKKTLAATAVLLLGTGLLGTAFLGGARADDDKKKKKDEDKSIESPIEVPEARSVFDRFAKKLKAEAWADAFAAVRELLDKHGDTLLLVEEQDKEGNPLKAPFPFLHLPAGAAVRRRLATMPPEGTAELAKGFGEDAAHRLELGKSTMDVGQLLEGGDRYFPLDEGGEALILAGDLELERGSVVGAALAWRDVFELHPNPALRLRAARRLVALLPAIGDAGTASDLARTIDAAELEGKDGLADAAHDAAARLATVTVPDVLVDASSGLAPVVSMAIPGEKAFRIPLSDQVPKNIDWRTETEHQNQWGQPILVVRRLLTGHLATDDYLLVHLGKSIFAYATEDDDENRIKAGEQVWTLGGEKGLGAFLGNLERTAALARFGIAIHGQRGFATLRTSSIDESNMPRGKLVSFRAEDGSLIWDTARIEADVETPRKKKKDEAAAEDEEEHLSFVGTPLYGGDKVFCGASAVSSPNETWVAALESKTGKLLWRRPLAKSSPFTAQQNPWDTALPRPTPTPSLALALGALLVLSNNGSIFALDPTDGQVLWARAYERDEEVDGRNRGWQRDASKAQASLARGYNPVVPFGDAAFVLPTDSANMWLFRCSDGAFLAKHGRDKYRHVLGVVQGRIVLSGEDCVSAFQVTRKKGHYQIESGDKLGQLTGRGSHETGRGTIIGDWALVPTEKAIVGFHVPDMKRKVFVEWTDAKKEMGDLVLGGGRLFSVGARNAHAYKEEE